MSNVFSTRKDQGPRLSVVNSTLADVVSQDGPRPARYV